MSRPSLPRRMFLGAAATLVGSAVTSPFPAAAKPARSAGKSAAAKRADAGPPVGAVPFKLSLSQLSLHKEFSSQRLNPLDFARVAAGFQLDAIEYEARFFSGKVSDRAYLAELKRRAVGEGVWSLLIGVEGEGMLGAAEAKTRKRAVERHKKWVEAAAFLGCHAIRVETASEGNEDEQATWLSDGLRRLAEVSDRYGIDVLVENGTGFSAKASWLAEVLAAVGHRRAGSAPDFGNFDLGGGQRYDRYQGVRELMPYARAVSARAYDFDARGEETSINYPQMLGVITTAGYRGYVSIRYSGDRLSEQAGIERTKALLERTRAQMIGRAEARR